MEQSKFEEIMARRKGKTPSKDNKSMGLIEEGIRGIARAPISIAAAPSELLDLGSRVATKAGTSLAAKVMGADPNELYKRQTESRSNINPLSVNKKVVEGADSLRDTNMLKGSESVEKGWKEGVKDPNWWMGNVAEAASFSGLLYKGSMNAIKKQGKKQIATLASDTASAEAKKLAKKQISRIGTRTAIKQSATVGAGMSHGDYRKWEKENPDDATVIGDMVGTLGGAAAGSLEGLAIKTHLMGPFLKKFGKDTAGKAASKFYTGLMANLAKGIATESTTEGIQTAIENTAAAAGYNDDIELTDGIVEAMIIGGMIGGGFGAANTQVEKGAVDTKEQDLMKVLKVQKEVVPLKKKSDELNATLAELDPESEEYATIANEAAAVDNKLAEYDATIQGVIEEGNYMESSPTEEEAFGSTIDPTLTIDEVAMGIENGEINEDQWNETAKKNFTQEQQDVINTHFEDKRNEQYVNELATGQTKDDVIDGTNKGLWGTLKDDFTSEEAVAALNENLGVVYQDGSVIAKPSTKAKNSEVIDQLSDILGVRTVRVELEGDNVFSGVVSPQKANLIFINDNSVRPDMWIFGHELGHSLEKTNPEAYSILLSMAKDEINDDKIASYSQFRDESMGFDPGSTTPEQATKEMFSDFMGDKFNDTEFWNKVYKENPTRFKQVIDGVREYIHKIMADFTGVSPQSDKFFKDLVKMEKTLVNVLNEHVGHTGAVTNLINSSVPTGDVIDVNEDNKHWNHIPIGDKGQMLMREDADNIYIKRFARAGAMRGTDMPIALNEGDIGKPTAALEQLKVYAKENGKNIQVITKNSNPYFTKQGFSESEGGSMTWTADAVTGADAGTAVAPEQTTTATSTPASKTDAKKASVERKLAEKERLDTTREIRRLNEENQIEQDIIETSSSREILLASKEKIDENNEKIVELEKILKKHEVANDTKDKESKKEVPGDGRKQPDTGKTQDTPESKTAGIEDTVEPEKGKIEEKKPIIKPTLVDKVRGVKRKEKSGSIYSGFMGIVDSLKKEGKQGDPVAFVEAAEELLATGHTSSAELAYQKAFKAHMFGEENEPTIRKKNPKVKGKKKGSKRTRKEQLKLDILIGKMAGISTDNVSNKLIADVEGDFKSFSKDIDERTKFDRFLEDEDLKELQFAPEKAYISVTKAIDDLKLDKKFPKSMAPDQWKGTIDKLSKKNKINPDNYRFSGVIEWLDEQNGNITREQVIDYLKNNPITVETNTIGETRTAYGVGANKVRSKLFELFEGDNVKDNVVDLLKRENPGMDNAVFDRRYFTLIDTLDVRSKSGDTTEQMFNAFRRHPLGYPVYKGMIDGYISKEDREILDIAEMYSEISGEYDTDSADAWLEETHSMKPEDLEEFQELEYENMSLNGNNGTYGEKLIKFDGGNKYKGTGKLHWGRDNILSHIRYGSHNHSDSLESSLVIYEMQSDWHADLRKGEGEHKVPDAPFKKSWPIITFKEVVKEAAHRGDDFVAWPSQKKQLAEIEGWNKDYPEITNFYTKKLPVLLNKVANKYGSKVETIETDRGQILNAVRITPEMETAMVGDILQFSAEPLDHKDPNPKVQKNIENAAKTPKRGPLTKIKDWVVAIGKMSSSPYAELRPGEHGYLKDRLRLTKEADKFASQQAYSKIYKNIGKLREDEKQVFTMNLILADILNDATPNATGEVLVDNGNVPFGYETIDNVRKSLLHFRNEAKKSPAVMRALANRRKMMLEIQGDLIDAGFLPKELRGNDAYFHHQVLQKIAMDESYIFGVDTGVGTKKLAFTTERGGKDPIEYSTDYITSEFGVISDAIGALELLKLKRQIKSAVDIRPRLISKAKGGEIIIPEGFTEWSPSRFGGWGENPSYPDKYAMDILNKTGLTDKQKEALIGNGASEKWVVKQEIANALTRSREVTREHPMAKLSNIFTQAWKKWTLINPLRVMRYNINNMSGDLDIAMAYDWRIMKYFNQSMKDIAGDIDAMGTKLPLNVQRFGTPMTPELKAEMKEAHRLGVIGAGFVMHEVANMKEEFEMLMRGPQGNKVYQTGMKWWQGSKDATNYRENLLRLASYRYFKDRIASGDKNVYGASNPTEIDSIKDPNEKAAKLSRELIGDYGRLSESGEWIRKHAIPFYSWMEINAPRYVRMMRNAKQEGKSGTKAGITALAGKSAVIGAKFMMFSAMVTLWNTMMMGDEEDELQGWQKRQMHLVLGRRADGSIRYLPLAGAFKDALSWFGGEDAYYDIEDVKSGRETVFDKVKQAGAAPLWKVYHGSRPISRTAIEATIGFTMFPKNKPMPIRDKFDYIAKSLSLEMIYRHATGKPTKGLVDEFRNKLYWNVDPGESAYYTIRDRINTFNEKNGKENLAKPITKKSTARYYYIQALRSADLKASQKYLQQYIELGGTKEGIQNSIKLAQPTSGLKKSDRSAFYRSLSDSDKVLLNKASKWYKNEYQGLYRNP